MIPGICLKISWMGTEVQKKQDWLKVINCRSWLGGTCKFALLSSVFSAGLKFSTIKHLKTDKVSIKMFGYIPSQLLGCI